MFCENKTLAKISEFTVRTKISWTSVRCIFHVKESILAKMSICIGVYTHCEINQNPCSNQEVHVLFEYGSEFENS